MLFVSFFSKQSRLRLSKWQNGNVNPDLIVIHMFSAISTGHICRWFRVYEKSNKTALGKSKVESGATNGSVNRNLRIVSWDTSLDSTVNNDVSRRRQKWASPATTISPSQFYLCYPHHLLLCFYENHFTLITRNCHTINSDCPWNGFERHSVSDARFQFVCFACRRQWPLSKIPVSHLHIC